MKLKPNKMTMIDLQKPPSELEIANVIAVLQTRGLDNSSDAVRRLVFERDGLLDLLNRFRKEVRGYCMPSMVQYDVFPVFKEVDELFIQKRFKLIDDELFAKKKEETDETS